MLDILSANTTYTLLGTLSLVSLTCLMFYPSSALRWMSKKRYQYEVTFSLYMMTPTEKFIFSQSSPFHLHSRHHIPLSLHQPSSPRHECPSVRIMESILTPYPHRLNPLPLPLNGHDSMYTLPSRTHRHDPASSVLLRAGRYRASPSCALGCR